MSQHTKEVNQGSRFEFGKNWQLFLKRLDENKIARAEKSLKRMLEVEKLAGKRFLDIGSGSGLFSLAAMRLGAKKVYSFDYDPQSVECTREIKQRYLPGAANWDIEQGSILDTDYLKKLGQFDIVYSWGVLHHTDNMWKALENAQLPVAPGGILYIAIYNDQGGASRRWTALKRLYNRSPKFQKLLLVLGIGILWEIRSAMIRLIRFQNPFPFKDWADLRESRGMSIWHNLIDWIGGYPFEVAKPEKIFVFYRDRGFELVNLTTCGGGHGNNQFVFKRRC